MNVEINHEQAADLAALEGMAAETAPGAEAGATPETDPAKVWAEIPAMVGSLLAMALPEVRVFYTPAACQEWGEKMVPIAAELGWDASEVVGPKMALVVASTPLILGPIMVIKARKAAAAQPEAQAQVENAGGNNKTIIFGSPDAAPLAP